MERSSAERDVLGCVLLSNSLWEQASVLREQDFYLGAHQCIFRRMRDLAESNLPIDESTLAGELDRHNEIEYVGGRAYVTSLTDGVVERKDISHFVAILQERALRRAGAKTGSELQKLANDGSVSPAAMAEVASRFTAEVASEADAIPPRFSEESLALRFSRLYADELRYVDGWGRWMCWDGMRWREDATLAVFDRCRAICRRASAECGDTKERAAVKIAAAQTVAAIERLARSDRRHAAIVEQWDADPWLLNTPVGTVDLRSGELLSHQREQYLTKTTAAGPLGDCLSFRRFLDRITDSNSELQAFLQRVIGYCLTGSVREHALFFLYGTGSNGKSVFLSTIAGLLGDYAKTAVRDYFGDWRAVEVTAEAVDQFSSKLLEGEPDGAASEKRPKSPATVNRSTQLLRQAYELAIKRRRLSNAPFIRHLSEKGNTRTGFFDERQFRQVLTHLPEYLQDYCLFGYKAGWRKGEIAALGWDDVEDDPIRLRGEDSKNGEPRMIVIEGELAEVMERRKAARQVARATGDVMLADLVFHHLGQPVGDFRKAWQTACVAAGVGKFVCRHCGQPTKGRKCEFCGTGEVKYIGRIFHDFRRTSVRNMVRAGVPERVAMSVSGHKTRSIFDRYNIVSEDDLRSAMQRTQDYLRNHRKREQPTVITKAAAKK